MKAPATEQTANYVVLTTIPAGREKINSLLVGSRKTAR